MQTLSVQARTALIANQDKDRATTGELDHWAKEEARYKADPENKALKAAIAKGEGRADAFLASAMNLQDANHATAYAEFKTKHGRDSKTARDTIIKETCTEMDAAPFDVRDPNYEKMVKELFKPKAGASAEEHHFFKAYQDAINAKHVASGYQGDAAWIKNYADKYGLKVNDNLQKLKDFQPRK